MSRKRPKRTVVETLQEQAERIVEEERAIFNFKGDVRVNPGSGFDGCIDAFTSSKVSVGYPADYEPDEVIEREVPGSFEKCCRVLVRHEFDHKGGEDYKGCPRTTELHLENMLEPTAEVLQAKGLPDVPVGHGHSLYSYFANMHEDVVDNFEVARKYDPAGVFGMYHHDTVRHDRAVFSPLFDAFVTVQEWLFADKRSKRLMGPHHCSDKKVKTAVDSVITRLGFDKVKMKVRTRRKRVEYDIVNKDKLLEYCLDEKNWPKIARVMSEEFAKLVDVNKLSQPDYVNKLFVPLKGAQDGFRQEVDNPETLMGQVWKKYGQAGKTKEFRPPAYIPKNKALALIYQRLARNMEIKVRASTSASSYPAVRFGWRPFEPETDNILRARIEYEGKLVLKSRKFTEDEPAEYQERKRDLPTVRVILRDDSESTRIAVPKSPNKGIVMNPWAPLDKQWTDRSRYHHMLVAEETLKEYLRQQGVLRHSTYKSVSFSSETRVANDLESSVELQYNPSFCSTTLDMDKLRKLFGKGELVFMMTDGEIQNWDDLAIEPRFDSKKKLIAKGVTVGEEYIRMAKENHTIHIYVGATRDIPESQKPESIRAIEKAGLPVYYDGGENVPKIMLDLTRPYVAKRVSA